jgi:uncharacterized protein (TIRG00374 family)
LMTEASKSSRAGDFVRVAVALLISGVAIWLLVRQIDLQAFLAALRSLTPLAMVLIIACFTVGLFVRGLVCWLILGKEFTFSAAFWAMNVGYLLNSILPLRLGEVGRAVLLVRHGKGKHNYPEVFAAIVTERMMDLMVGSLFFLATLPLMVGESNLKRVVIITAAALLIASGVIFVSTSYRERLVSWLQDRFGSKKLIKEKVIPALDKLLTGFQIFQKPKLFFAAFFLLAVSWAMTMVEFTILQDAILNRSQWWWPLLITPASAFVNALPAAPAGLGVFEAGAVAAYSLVGVGKADSLAMALVVHAVQVIIPVFIGMIGIYVMGENLGSLVRSARRQAGGGEL